MPFKVTYTEKATHVKYSRGNVMENTEIRQRIEELEKKGVQHHIVLDVLSLSNITSFEIGILIRLRNAVKKANKLLFVALRSPVKAMLEKTAVTKLDGIHYYVYDKPVDEIAQLLEGLNLKL
jgi:anti-anti-sigma regulatory factor